MKKFIVFIIAMCMVLTISGCTESKIPEIQNSSQNLEVEVPDTPVTEQRIIQSAALSQDVSSWKAVSSYEGDIDDDDEYEVVELVTSAEYDRKKGFFWNDGQEWALLVKDGDESYLLYKEYINSGTPYFEVSQYYTADGDKVQIDFVVTSGSKLMLAGYSYSEEEDGYIETIIYNSDNVSDDGLNKLYSSFPMY